MAKVMFCHNVGRYLYKYAHDLSKCQPTQHYFGLIVYNTTAILYYIESVAVLKITNNKSWLFFSKLCFLLYQLHQYTTHQSK